jgi:hypothetical protein
MRSPGSLTRVRTAAPWLVPAALFAAASVVTAAFRFLALANGFSNDHFVYITGGWQMLFGEWPTRDFIDPGLPLMFASSALAQSVLGPTLFAEAVLVALFFGLAAAITGATVLHLTRSLVLAAVATVLEVAVFPRTYGYPKILVYAVGFLLFARYVSKPTLGRLCAIAAAVAVAFMFRHDHGLFLWAGAMVMLMLQPEAATWKASLQRMAVFTACVVAILLPYLVYVEVNGGLWTYFRTGIEFSQREAERQWHVWPKVIGDPRPLDSAMVYELHLIPFIAGAVLLTLGRTPEKRAEVARIAPLIAVAFLVNYNFIRDPLNTRLPDAIVPAVVLGAWIVHRAQMSEKLKLVALPAALSGLFIMSASVFSVGQTWEQLDRTDVIRAWRRTPELFRERTADLQSRFVLGYMPTRSVVRLQPFFAYLDRCTTIDHRLLIGGFLPEVPFFARRRFAAGQGYFGAYFGSDENQRTALRRLRGQVVPFVILPSDYTAEFDERFSLVAPYVRARYRPLTDVQVDDYLTVRILVDGELGWPGRDAETGWPCTQGSQLHPERK